MRRTIQNFVRMKGFLEVRPTIGYECDLVCVISKIEQFKLIFHHLNRNKTACPDEVSRKEISFLFYDR